MTFPSPEVFDSKTLRNYGAARAQTSAYEAVIKLWRKRRDEEGLRQAHLAERLGRNAGWVSRALAGPGNWTIKTFGELVAALNGEIEISVSPLERSSSSPSNYDAYAEFDEAPGPIVPRRPSARSAYLEPPEDQNVDPMSTSTPRERKMKYASAQY